jgi:hypothetical protein
MENIEILSMYADIYQKTNTMDCAISIIDDKGIIIHYIKPKHMVLSHIETGSRIQPGSAQAEAWETKKEVRRDIPSDVFGMPLRAIAIPIFDRERFIGVVAMAIDLKAQENLYTTARGVSSSAQEIGATTEEVAATSESLAKALKDLQNNSGNVLSNIRKTDDILRFVNSVAGNSNLLGLNAAIEAARVGEYGRGFSVVAEEIRKMASDSQDAVRQINSIIELIQNSIKSIIGEIDMVSNLSERQAVAIEQIASSVQRLADSAADIEQVAKEL